MPILKIPAPLRPYVNGQSEVTVRGATAGEAMSDLAAQFPAFRPHLFDGEGCLRPFINLFFGVQNIKDLRGLETPLSETDALTLVPSIAGG
jgi:adenylyltransferase/sulfurtransferase